MTLNDTVSGCHINLVTLDDTVSGCHTNLVTLDDAVSGCHTGWVAAEGLCYRLVHRSASFQTADETCSKMDATLLTVESDTESHFMSNWLMAATGALSLVTLGSRSLLVKVGWFNQSWYNIELRHLDVRHFVIEECRHLGNGCAAKCG